MLRKIWYRKIFLQGIKYLVSFFLLITSFYIFVDFFIHSSKYAKVENSELIVYYLSQTLLLSELFLPLSFLLALIKILTSLTIHRESVAYQVAGLSKTQLMSPFFMIAILISLFTLYREQYLFPSRASFADEFQEKYLSTSFNKKIRKVRSIKFKDNSQLIYQNYDPKSKVLSDVFYILSFNEIWHIETLHIENPIIGTQIDHFIRDEKHLLKKIESFDEHIFKKTKIDIEDLQVTFVPYANRSLSELATRHFSSKEEMASMITQLNKKLVLSIIPLLILLCVGPYCLKFSRNFSPFLISAISLFSFAGFFALFNGILLLCENQIFSPYLGCWALPFGLLIFGTVKIR